MSPCLHPCGEALQCYEQMLPLTEQMLTLARSDQWAGLGPLEGQFSALAARLRHLPPCTGADPDTARRMGQLHARVQANHGLLQGLVQPELDRLATAIRRMQWQQGLHDTYSRPGRALL